MRKLVIGSSFAVLALVGIGMGGCNKADNIKYEYPTNEQEDDIRQRGPSRRGGRV